MGVYAGYNLKLDGVIFPNSLIQFESYKCTPNQIMDLDPYRDGDGVLHRNILPHTATKIEFNTPYLHSYTLDKVREFIKKKDDVSVEYWSDDIGEYKTGIFYIPDIVFEQVNVNEAKGVILYKPIRLAFIEK